VLRVVWRIVVLQNPLKNRASGTNLAVFPTLPLEGFQLKARIKNGCDTWCCDGVGFNMVLVKLFPRGLAGIPCCVVVILSTRFKRILQGT
jgi:hypothetical protein